MHVQSSKYSIARLAVSQKRVYTSPWLPKYIDSAKCSMMR